MIRAIMLGAGNRGLGTYGMYALKHPGDIQFIAVADPDEERRHYFQEQHKIDPSLAFSDAQEVLKIPKFADAMFICTQDKLHVDQVLKALRLGYHVFLEKPMAIKPKDILRIERQQRMYHRKMVVAHVLRYSPFFLTIKRLLDEGHIGDIIAVNHVENVGVIHHSHSYVRGNWRNSQLASPMILAKSCHDMDILAYLIDSKPLSVASFGELTHFKKETKTNVPDYCLDGCPEQDHCPFYAPKVYLNAPDWMRFPVSNDLSDEAILEALKKGPYGRCVYRSDNDVVDHQSVTMQFEKGITVNFLMTSFTNEITRTIHIMGTKGELWGDMNDPIIRVKPFGQNELSIKVDQAEGGHGGGDEGVMKRFINALKYDWDTTKDVEIAVVGHLLAFASETSRLEHKIVDYQAFVEEHYGKR